MGVLQRFENRLESMVSGAFARAFRSEVQPVEVAAALQREVDNSAQILSRDRRLVPNNFHVELSPADHERLSQYGSTLAKELTEMLRDTRSSVWTELTAGSPVSIHRRSLQRSYLESVDRVLNPPPVSAAQAAQMAAFGQSAPHPNSDVRPALRGELLEIDRMAAAALNRTNDAMTRLHLRDVRLEIERILDVERRNR